MEDNPKRTLTVGPDGEGIRLDIFCADRIDHLSRNQIQKLNKEGCIRVNSSPRPHSYSVKEGDVIEIDLPGEKADTPAPLPQNIPIKIVYEDSDLVVANKEAGMVVHPAHGNWDGTLVNALLGSGIALSSLGGKLRPGIVHRLDKDTSGLLVVAKSDVAYKELGNQIKAKKMRKIYHAIIWGSIGADELSAESPIGRHPVHRKKMAVVERGGREAVSKMFVMDSFDHFEYIRVEIGTGRTHQIRVHLSHSSHPILGDPVYGGRKKRGPIESARVNKTVEKLLKIMRRQALHASTLSFIHPVTGNKLRFKAALPDDMQSALEVLYLEDRARGG